MPDIIDISSFTSVPAQGSQVCYPALGPQAGAIGPAGVTAQGGAQILDLALGPLAGTPLAPAILGIAYYLPEIVNIPGFTVVPAQGTQVYYLAPGPQAASPRTAASFRIAHHLPRVVDAPSDAVVTAQGA